MKINDLNSINQLIRTGTGAERRAPAGHAQTFRETLSGLTQANAMQQLTEMGDELSRQGEILGRRCDILELKRYREKLAEYLHEAVRFIYEFKKQSTMDARGRHKMYAIVKTINQKLEEMTEEILKQESNNLLIMAAVDEIRGMLVDLML